MLQCKTPKALDHYHVLVVSASQHLVLTGQQVETSQKHHQLELI